MRSALILALFMGCLLLSACGKSRRPEKGETVRNRHNLRETKTAASPKPKTAGDAFITIKRYCGKNLKTLEEDRLHVLRDAIATLVPGRSYRQGLFDFRPLWVGESKRKEGNPFYLLIEEMNGPHPGSTGIWTTELSNEGSVISDTMFWIGHRHYLKEMTIEEPKKGEHTILSLTTVGLAQKPGTYRNKQYYARIENHYALVRLEDFTGKATRNIYYIKHFQCGPPVPRKTALQWELDLLSQDRLKLLRALVWLGGVHLDLSPGEGPNSPEDTEEAILVRQVGDRPKVIVRLKKLAESKDPWLREAAHLALTPKYDR